MPLTPETSSTHKHPVEIFRPRFPRFLKTVLEPAVHAQPTPLRVAAWQSDRAVPYAEAAAQAYCEITPGFRWGPVWSTCWFRLTGAVPHDLAAGEPLDLRFSTRTEATLWLEQGGTPTPVRGLDINRDTVDLSRYLDLSPGQLVTLLVEAACNHPFGVSTFDWDISDTHDRWRSDDPGHFLYAELAPRHEPIRRLAETYRFASRLLDELDPASSEAGALFDALTAATHLIDDREVASRADEARATLAAALRSPGRTPASEPIGFAVAHAHIDTAWLWPLRETRRKIVRSWTNALEVLDANPDASFICSQAQQYAYLKEDAPLVFERLRERVAEGRFEPMGSMWVEPDVNVPSAESLIRQVLLGQRFWRDEVDRAPGGPGSRQTILYLPDTFGFPASLPDIMLACGLDTFITNKIAWNQCHAYPHTNFRWRGLGGAHTGEHVLAHFTPNHDYNCANSPRELIKTKANIRPLPEGTGEAQQVFLHPYGFGDGGGGPTHEQAGTISTIAPDGAHRSHPALPSLRHGTVRDFRERLHALDRGLADTSAGGLPLHDRELYLELHRATLTTHAWLKQANRDAERDLRAAELLTFAGPAGVPANAKETADQLTEAWKLLCLQQFHDILPGSSITPVYDDARRDFAEINDTATTVINSAFRNWTEEPRAQAGGPPNLSILNPSSSTVSTIIEHNGQLHHAHNLPPPSISPLTNAPAPPPVTLESAGNTATLRNQHLEARIDEAGRIVSLRALTNNTPGPELAASPLNRLALYRDIPMNWDAWDLDAYTEDELLETNESPAESWCIKTDAPLRAEIEIVRAIGNNSRITQTIRLDAGSPRLDIITEYDWDETNRYLRLEMPTTIDTRTATYDIQAGTVERPTTRKNPEERMMFEVCAHRWMDLSDPASGAGLSMLNTGRYGCGARREQTADGVRTTMHLSLLRAPTHPDPTAGTDSGSITVSLLPHAGDWRSADTDRFAEAINFPPRVIPADCGEPWSPIEITEAPGQRLEIATIKPAYDDPTALVVRLIETRGAAGEATVRWSLPVASVERTDAIERSGDGSFTHTGETTTIPVRAHEIVTLLATRA